jgi:hypothetical protein
MSRTYSPDLPLLAHKMWSREPGGRPHTELANRESRIALVTHLPSLARTAPHHAVPRTRRSQTVGAIAHSCPAAYQLAFGWFFGPGGANLWISEVNGTGVFTACVFLS